MNKLLAHFKAMQAMCSRYIEPGPYIDRDGHEWDVDTAAHAWQNDMIYMLDGPEQRDAQADAEQDEGFNTEWRMDIRKQVEQADAIAKHAREQAKGLELRVTALTDDNNDLRSRLMNSELAYAKLTGYLDRVEDERPPVMVPQERERFRAQIPDGTRGTEYSGWRGGDSHRDRCWYHR